MRDGVEADLCAGGRARPARSRAAQVSVGRARTQGLTQRDVRQCRQLSHETNGIDGPPDECGCPERGSYDRMCGKLKQAVTSVAKPLLASKSALPDLAELNVALLR